MVSENIKKQHSVSNTLLQLQTSKAILLKHNVYGIYIYI